MIPSDIEFVVFDLEANADRSDRPEHEIIEIGAVLVSGGSEVGAFQTLVRPTRRLRDFTRRLTGLTDGELASAPLPADARPDEIVVLIGTEDLRGDVMRLVPDAFDTKSTRNRNRLFDVRGEVRVATLRLLKGLEFRHVIVGGANHISVHAADAESSAEDQRRLLYVGVTRATETLTITYSGEGIMSALEKVPELGA